MRRWTGTEHLIGQSVAVAPGEFASLDVLHASRVGTIATIEGHRIAWAGFVLIGGVTIAVDGTQYSHAGVAGAIAWNVRTCVPVSQPRRERCQSALGRRLALSH